LTPHKNHQTETGIPHRNPKTTAQTHNQMTPTPPQPKKIKNTNKSKKINTKQKTTPISPTHNTPK
jgi:hypothetical protein